MYDLRIKYNNCLNSRYYMSIYVLNVYAHVCMCVYIMWIYLYTHMYVKFSWINVLKYIWQIVLEMMWVNVFLYKCLKIQKNNQNRQLNKRMYAFLTWIRYFYLKEPQTYESRWAPASCSFSCSLCAQSVHSCDSNLFLLTAGKQRTLRLATGWDWFLPCADLFEFTSGQTS
jgi:hypothetical protein